MAVSVVGFDIGGLTSYVAVAKHGRQRLIGTSAKLQHTTNVKNTFTGFIPLVGKKASDAAISRERTYLAYNVEADPNGRVVVKANYNDGQLMLFPEQLLAMQLTKLKRITEISLGSKVVDVVINVPTYYTDAERRALLDCSRIAGLNCVKLVNDLTAIATAYGLYNADLPALDKPPKNVAFVSVGHISTQVAICAFNAGKVKVLSTACDSQLGGRNFDQAIFTKFAEEFFIKHKVKEWSADVLSRFEGVLTRCIELSKLQVNEIHSVELVGGSSRVPALKNIVSSMFKQDGRTTLNADEAVARGCALQAAICSPAYKVREFSVTEVCPYGITLHWDREDCGDQSSVLPVENDGEVTVESKDGSIEVFPFLHNIPLSRRFFFNRHGPFTLEARYTTPADLPIDNSYIGSFRVELPFKSTELTKVRVKVRVNAHGIFSLSQAEYAEEYEKEVEVEDPEQTASPVKESNGKKEPTEDAPMEATPPGNGDVTMDTASSENTNTAAPPAPEPVPVVEQKPVVKKKKTIKKKAIRYKDLAVEPSIMQFNTHELNNFCEVEGQLFEQDELEQKRANAKNSVEEYVYEMRTKLQDRLSQFATPGEIEQLLQQLNETEDWLYSDGEDLQRQAYADRLNAMKTSGDPIEMREAELKNRGTAVQRFEQSLVRIRKVLDSLTAGEITYDHLTEEQLNQLRTTTTQAENWLRDQLHIQNAKPLHEDPVLLAANIVSQQQTMEGICHPIINTPKPVAPPPPTPAEPTEETTNGPDTGNSTTCPVKNGVSSGKGNKTSSKPVKTSTDKAENMDVD